VFIIGQWKREVRHRLAMKMVNKKGEMGKDECVWNCGCDSGSKCFSFRNALK